MRLTVPGVVDAAMNNTAAFNRAFGSAVAGDTVFVPPDLDFHVIGE